MDGAGPSAPGGTGWGPCAPAVSIVCYCLPENSSRGKETPASVSSANKSLGREPGPPLENAVSRGDSRAGGRGESGPGPCKRRPAHSWPPSPAGPTPHGGCGARGPRKHVQAPSDPMTPAGPSAGAPRAAGQWTQEPREQLMRLLFTNKAVARGDVHSCTKVRAPLENAGRSANGRPRRGRHTSAGSAPARVGQKCL